RDEGGYDDRRRKQHGLVDLESADQNEPQPVGPCLRARCIRLACWIRPPLSCCQLLQEPSSLFGSGLEVSIDIFHENHCCIDNNAEIYGTHRQQICVFVSNV